jgi:hypothetical protein
VTLDLKDDWFWAAAIVAIPAVIFGAFEMMMWMRRRRLDAVARRPKATRGQPDSRVRSDRGA